MVKHWLDYFEWNRTHRRPIPWQSGAHVEAGLRKPFIRSLQRFQVGESGEGLHLRKQAARTGCAVYQQCIDLFIKEEQEHARLMAKVLGMQQAPLLKHHWTDIVSFCCGGCSVWSMSYWCCWCRKSLPNVTFAPYTMALGMRWCARCASRFCTMKKGMWLST
jgi:hypothetical protein